ncbi:MAG: hypothetical protein WBD02_00265, partial [Acidimicrobiia bacterium]
VYCSVENAAGSTQFGSTVVERSLPARIVVDSSTLDLPTAIAARVVCGLQLFSSGAGGGQTMTSDVELWLTPIAGQTEF